MANIVDALDAKEEIRDLMARYCFYLDSGRYDEYVSCYTEDGAYNNPLFGRHAGKNELREFVESYRTSLGTAQYRLWIVNVHIDVDIDAGRATSKSYWLYTKAAEGKTELVRSGRFEDQIVKVNGKWLFKERKVHQDSEPAT